MRIIQNRQPHIEETIYVTHLREKEILNKLKEKYSTQIQEKMNFLSVNSLINNKILSSYHFVLDENLDPIIVGDNLFGVVYLLYDHATLRKFAIKIYYSTTIDDQETKLRFKHEHSLTYYVNQDERVDLHNTGLVNILGGTESFRDSNAYKSLKSYFADNRINVSNYAIIMDYYDFTLKDVLELKTGLYCVRKKDLYENINIEIETLSEIETLCDRPMAHESELKKNISKIINENDEVFNKICSCISQWNGYDILSCLDFNTRFKTIAGFLLEIAKGIKTLHLCGFYHLDLKPGNIFVDKRGNCVIGNFEFLDMLGKNKKTSDIATIPSLLPLGTKHYRSPEQKDFYDICDVKIECLSETKYRLTSLDPKFFNTIVE